MTVMIIYATIEGQTGKIAEFAKAKIEEHGGDVRIVDAGDPMADISFDEIDRVILAAPVHERRHPQPFEILVETNRLELNELPTLFLSVSLNAAFAEGFEEADDYAIEMEMRTGFKPNFKLLVAGAVRTGKYDYYASQVLRHIVLRGHDVDQSKEEHEFTDWEAISKAISSFLAR